MSQSQLQLVGVREAAAAEDLFQPAGAKEEVAASDGPPASSRALATLAHLKARLGGYQVVGADHLVRDPIGRTTEVWRFHPESPVWLELVEVRRDATDSPEELELLVVAAEVRAA